MSNVRPSIDLCMDALPAVLDTFAAILSNGSIIENMTLRSEALCLLIGSNYASVMAQFLYHLPPWLHCCVTQV